MSTKKSKKSDEDLTKESDQEYFAEENNNKNDGKISFAKVACSRLDPGVQGEHFTTQLSWLTALLLVTCVCSVYLVNK